MEVRHYVWDHSDGLVWNCQEDRKGELLDDCVMPNLLRAAHTKAKGQRNPIPSPRKHASTHSQFNLFVFSMYSIVASVIILLTTFSEAFEQ